MRRCVGPPTLRCLFLLSGARGDGQSASATQLEQVGVTAVDPTSDEIQVHTQDDSEDTIRPDCYILCNCISFAWQLTVRSCRGTVSAFSTMAGDWV